MFSRDVEVRLLPRVTIAPRVDSMIQGLWSIENI